MKDKVFWSLLGAILLGWVLLFAFLVWPKMTEYDKVTDKLSKEKKAIQVYAKMDVEELPTDDLVEAKENFLKNWRKQLDRATQFHENRSALFTEGAVSDLSSWATRYRDNYDLLVNRYVQHTGYAGDMEDIPVKVQEDLSDPSKVEKYEKYWKVQKFLVDEVIAIPGASIAEEGLEVGKRTRGNKDETGRFQVVMLARVPPAQIGNLVDNILRHTFVDFDVKQLSVSKDRNNLIFDVIEEVAPESHGVASEPVVWLRLELDVLEGIAAEGSQ